MKLNFLLLPGTLLDHVVLPVLLKASNSGDNTGFSGVFGIFSHNPNVSAETRDI